MMTFPGGETAPLRWRTARPRLVIGLELRELRAACAFARAAAYTDECARRGITELRFIHGKAGARSAAPSTPC